MFRTAHGHLRRVVRRNTGFRMFLSTEIMQKLPDVDENYFPKKIRLGPKMRIKKISTLDFGPDYVFRAPDG